MTTMYYFTVKSGQSTNNNKPLPLYLKLPRQIARQILNSTPLILLFKYRYADHSRSNDIDSFQLQARLC